MASSGHSFRSVGERPADSAGDALLDEAPRPRLTSDTLIAHLSAAARSLELTYTLRARMVEQTIALRANDPHLLQLAAATWQPFLSAAGIAEPPDRCYSLIDF